MDVTCDKCRTEYEFDDSLISDGGTTVKCTNCGHLFRIYRPGTPEAQRKPAWMLRQPDGSVYTFERIATLKRWIAEGKVSREDEVSRTGEGWKRLGFMDELAVYFEKASAALDTADENSWNDDGPTIRRPTEMTGGTTTPQLASNPGNATPQNGAQPVGPSFVERAPYQQQPSNQPGSATLENSASLRYAPEWSQGSLLPDSQPAWTGSDRAANPDFEPEPSWTDNRVSSISLKREPEDEDDEPLPTKGALFKVGVPILLVGLVAVSLGGLYILAPKFFRDLLSQVITEGNPRSSSEAFLHGREYFLLDTTEGFRQADREYHRAEPDDGLSQAGLAEVYTTWSQYSLDEVADYHLKAAKAEPTEAAALKARADVKNEEFQQKLEQARRFVDAALKRAQGSVEAHRAAADYYRLTGDLEQAKRYISRALQIAQDDNEALPETRYVEALVELTLSGDTQAAVKSLQSVASQNSKLIRCHYRLARLLGATGEFAKSRSSLMKVLELNEEHEHARSLLETLDSGEVPLIAVTSSTIIHPGTESLTSSDASADGSAADGSAADGAIPDGEESEVESSEPDLASSDEPDSGPEKVGSNQAAPMSFEAILRRATKAQSNGSPEACSLFRSAHRLRPGHPEALVGLGYCAADSGNRSQAIGYYRRALSANRNYGPALLALASAYRNQGNHRQALVQYRRYLSSHPSGAQAGMARRNIARLEELLRTEGSDSPQSDAPAPTSKARPGSPENPTVTNIRSHPAPPTKRTDSLAIDSEPPLRPGEDLD